MFRRFIDAVYDGLLNLGDEETIEMGDHDGPEHPVDDGPEHPVDDGLELTDIGSARDFQEDIAEEVQVSLIPGEDPRLAEITMTFVDEHGVRREWSVSHHAYDTENYE